MTKGSCVGNNGLNVAHRNFLKTTPKSSGKQDRSIHKQGKKIERINSMNAPRDEPILVALRATDKPNCDLSATMRV